MLLKRREREMVRVDVPCADVLTILAPKVDGLTYDTYEERVLLGLHLSACNDPEGTLHIGEDWFDLLVAD